jgi:hypothetical protein
MGKRENLRWDARHLGSREAATLLVERANVLPAPDRELLGAVYLDSKLTIEVAALMRAEVRIVRRRVQALVDRVLSPAFVHVMRHGQEMAPMRRAVADAMFIRGLQKKQAAQELGMSEYQVRRHRVAIEALVEQEARVDQCAKKAAAA